MDSREFLAPVRSVYLTILAASLLMAAAATALCLLLGFPLALFISRARTSEEPVPATGHSAVLDQLSGAHLRLDVSAARHRSAEHGAPERWHLIREPLPLLYNDGAVLLGLVYGYLPFMVLPLYATLERLDPALLEAAADLGAKPWSRRSCESSIPLAAPGIRAGSILVFIPCVGAFLTPDLLGGGKTVMVGNLIQNQFTTARDWPFGSAVSLALMAIVVSACVAFLRRGSEEAAVNRGARAVYAGGAFAFLHLPLMILVVFSFNAFAIHRLEGLLARTGIAPCFRDAQICRMPPCNSIDDRAGSTILSTVDRHACAYGFWKRAIAAAFRARCICPWSRRRS